LERIEILNKKESDDDPAGDGPKAFKDIDFSDGSSILLDVLKVEIAPVGKQDSLGECHREKDQEGDPENRPEAEPLSWSGEKGVSEYSREINGQRKGYGKKQLEKYKDLQSPIHFFRGFTDDKGTDGHEDEPVGQNDAEGELVSVKRDEELSHQDDLGDDPAQSLNEERDLEGSDAHHKPSMEIVRSLEVLIFKFDLSEYPIAESSKGLPLKSRI
jgi:hypothetical protein